MSTTKTLTVAQLLVLNTAAQRPEHMVLPLPARLGVRGASAHRLLGALLKAALIEEQPVADDTLCWRRDDAGQAFGLRLTAVGLAAVHQPDIAHQEVPLPETVVTTPPAGPPDADQEAPAATQSEDAPNVIASGPATAETPDRPAGKLGQVLAAVTGETGATLVELVTLTGWQPHTTRAALTRLRQRGFAVSLHEHDGRKAYHLAEATPQ